MNDMIGVRRRAKSLAAKIHRIAFALDKISRDSLRLLAEERPEEAQKLLDALNRLDFYRCEIKEHRNVVVGENQQSTAFNEVLYRIAPLTIELVDRIALECGGRRVRECEA